MSVLSNTSLRKITKMVQILKIKHQIHIPFSDPELTSKLHQQILTSADSTLLALWDEMPEDFKVGSTLYSALDYEISHMP